MFYSFAFVYNIKLTSSNYHMAPSLFFFPLFRVKTSNISLVSLLAGFVNLLQVGASYMGLLTFEFKLILKC